MSGALIFGGLIAAGGVIAMLVLESKLIGLVMSGVGALFLVISFYGDFAANKNATASDFAAEKAEFNRDFAKASGADKQTIDDLAIRAKTQRDKADAAEAKREKVQTDGEKTRKPLMDAVTHQINEASKQDEPKGSMSN